MPGRKWYGVAGVVLVASLAAFAFFLFTQIRGIGDAFDRFVVPGTAEVEVEEAGRHTIFHESTSTVDGTVYRVGDVTGLEIEVLSPSGERVEVGSPTGSMNYQVGGREGVAIATFVADGPGAHRITAEYRSGSGPETVLAVSRGFGTRIVTTVLGSIGLALGGTFLAVAIAVTTFVLRFRASRRARMAGRPPTVG